MTIEVRIAPAVIVLDESTNNVHFHPTKIFSGGEVHVGLVEDSLQSKPFCILAAVHSSTDLMELLMKTDALRRAGAGELSLVLPYIPYARQDRVAEPGESLSIKVFCDLINSQKYSSVTVWDAHSDVALALLDRVDSIEQSKLLSRYVRRIKRDTILVAPDAGAIKKITKCAKALSLDYVRADKTRDTKTGQITGTVVYSEHVGSRDFLIVDDICDGGRTFVELAKELRKLTTGKVNLYVTHGIFSAGTQVFDGLIDQVFVPNSFVKTLPSNFIV